MLASFARESPHRASFTARRGSMTTGTRCAASANRPAQQDRVEHLGADGHPVGLDLLDDDDVGQPARPQRPDEDVVGGDPEPLRPAAVEPQPGGLGEPGSIARTVVTATPAGRGTRAPRGRGSRSRARRGPPRSTRRGAAGRRSRRLLLRPGVERRQARNAIQSRGGDGRLVQPRAAVGDVDDPVAGDRRAAGTAPGR